MENKTDNIKEIKSIQFIEIKNDEFKLLSNLVYEKIGINLTVEKKNLVMGRLQKVLRSYNLHTFKEYYNFVLSDKTGNALSELANSISTNHTFFYRENDHFEFFSNIVLPEIDNRMKATKSSDIRLWSAGCSSGEEPFTLIMLLMEYFTARYKSIDGGILATDISEKALTIARQGKYQNERVKHLPKLLQKKYFRKLTEDEWQVVDEVKNEVTYRRFNLMNENFPFKKKFDVIFCRNVMIYFDPPTRKTLVTKFYDLTADNGYLFIGHSETLNRLNTNYKYIMPAVYKKVI